MHLDFGIPDDPEELKRWLKLQPPEVQDAAVLFPLKVPIYLGAITYWVVGYVPDGALVCIKRDPDTISRSEFHQLMTHPDLLDPVAIRDISTRH